FLALASWCAGSAIKRPREPVPVTPVPRGEGPCQSHSCQRSCRMNHSRAEGATHFLAPGKVGWPLSCSKSWRGSLSIHMDGDLRHGGWVQHGSKVHSISDLCRLDTIVRYRQVSTNIWSAGANHGY